MPLPEWIFGEDVHGVEYAVRLHYPRLVGRIVPAGQETVSGLEFVMDRSGDVLTGVEWLEALPREPDLPAILRSLEDAWQDYNDLEPEEDYPHA